MAIRSFRNDEAMAAFEGRLIKGFPVDLLRVAQGKLAYLDAAVSVDDLRSPPATG